MGLEEDKGIWSAWDSEWVGKTGSQEGAGDWENREPSRALDIYISQSWYTESGVMEPRVGCWGLWPQKK